MSNILWKFYPKSVWGIAFTKKWNEIKHEAPFFHNTANRKTLTICARSHAEKHSVKTNPFRNVGRVAFTRNRCTDRQTYRFQVVCQFSMYFHQHVTNMTSQKNFCVSLEQLNFAFVWAESCTTRYKTNLQTEILLNQIDRDLFVDFWSC